MDKKNASIKNMQYKQSCENTKKAVNESKLGFNGA
jgi:hypothetical protein